MRRVWRGIGRLVEATLGASASDGAPRRGGMARWARVGAFWLMQWAVLFVAVPLVLLVWDAGSIVDDWLRVLGEPGYWLWMTVAAGILTALQAVLLWPVRKPGLSGKGWPLRLSACVAGALGSLLILGVLLVMSDVFWLIDQHAGTSLRNDGEAAGLPISLAGMAILGVSWAMLTPMIWAFVRRGDTETALSRVSARLFQGTVLEAVAIIPLDVMVRRKTDCYCEHGTLWALAACIGIGTVVAGPAAWLPILARRRKRHSGGACRACGYDMRGNMKAERCPECGSGWRVARPCRGQ